jgi:hypothetical protein
MGRERRTDDGTYPEVEDELAKVAERAAATAGVDVASADPKAVIGAHWDRRTHSAAVGFFRGIGIPAPEGGVDELAKLLRIARDGALEEAAAAIELIEGRSPAEAARIAKRYVAGIRAMKTES